MDRTEKLITDSFLSLLEKNRYHSITVKKIIEDCQISRNTFYYHFSCIPEIPERFFQEQMLSIVDENAPRASLEECLIQIERYLEASRVQILNMLNSVDRKEFHRVFQRICRDCAEEYVRITRQEKNLDEEDREILMRFFTSAGEGILMDWFEHGMDYDIVSKTRRLMQLLRGDLNIW